MEKDFLNYCVVVRNLDAGASIIVFSSGLIDEACAFALSLFRSVNVHNLDILVHSQVEGRDLVTFTRE